jgi:ribosome-associated protein
MLVVNGRPVLPVSAMRFSFTTSSGPGGQNVNKRATRCELRVALADLLLPPDAVERLRAASSWLVTGAGELVIESDEHRSQKRNQDACVERLEHMIRAAMVRPKVRRATRPTRSSVRRRIEEKKRNSERKRRRGAGGDD